MDYCVEREWQMPRCLAAGVTQEWVHPCPKRVECMFGVDQAFPLTYRSPAKTCQEGSDSWGRFETDIAILTCTYYSLDEMPTFANLCVIINQLHFLLLLTH